MINSSTSNLFEEMRKSSALFGYIAIKKGYATDQQIKYALAKQQRLFKEKDIKQMIGDMLVESGVLTKEQHQTILKYQHAAKFERGSKGSKDKEFKESYRKDEKIEQKESDNEEIKIVVSSNKMEAWVEINPKPNRSEESKSITLLDIKSALNEKGIINGILTDSLLQRHIDRKDDLFLAAVGNYSYSHLPDFQFEAKLLDSHLITTHFVSKYPIISNSSLKRDKTLAFLHSDQVEIKGYDLFGKVSVLVDSNCMLLRCGKWCTISEDKIRVLSEQTGYPGLSIEGKFYIFPVVNVLGDADIRFGPIDLYASLNVAGLLTGAYPVYAGQIQAREIRGATISSIGDISVDIGITECRIKTQGDIRAKYIHKSRIESFGNVNVEHEIIDSTIAISGSLNIERGRIIASKIFAKMGVNAAVVGSDITEPCYINAGSEEHIILKVLEINRQISNVKRELDELIGKRANIEQQIKELFKQMVDMKLIHDRAKSKVIEMTQNGSEPILEDIKKRMEEALDKLKKYNKQKKSLEATLEKVISSIIKLKPKAEKEIMQLEIDRLKVLKWAESIPPIPDIIVSAKLAEETTLQGVLYKNESV